MTNFFKKICNKITSLFKLRIMYGESSKGHSYSSKHGAVFQGGILGTGKEKNEPNTPDFKDWKDV